MRERLLDLLKAEWAAEHLLPAVLILAATVVFGIGAGRLSRRAADRLPPQVDVTVRSLIAGLASWTVYVGGAFAVLDALGVNTRGLFAALGAVALSVGLALRETLGNVAAGLAIVVFRPIAVGEYITFANESSARSSGTVVKIGPFMTQLRTYDGLYVSVPNRVLMQEPVMNYDRNGERMVKVVVGISYRDSIDAGLRALMAAGNAEKRALADRPVQVFVESLEDSAVTLSLRLWVAKADYWPVRRALVQAAKEAVERAGLTIPFPQRDVHLDGAAGVPAPAAPAGITGL